MPQDNRARMEEALRNAHAAGDTAAATRIAQALRSAQTVQPEANQEAGRNWYDPIRSTLQGMTFGGSDEIGSAIAAIPASIGSDQSYKEAYRDIHGTLSDQRTQYRENHPVEAAVTEMAGGLVTGAAGGAKVLGSKAVQAMAPAAKTVTTALTGATEGGIYGFLASDPGSRGSGAATGAAFGGIMAPVGVKGAEMLGGGAKKVAIWAKQKFGEVPEQQAMRLLREVADKAGLSADDIIREYRALGHSGTLMDVDDNMRGTTRALTDRLGPAKREVKQFLDARQTNQGQRLVDALRDTVTDTDAGEELVRLISSRQAQASPLYDKAWDTLPTPKLGDLVQSRGTLAKALKAGAKLANDMGEPNAVGFKQFHYAKMAIDVMIEQQRKSPTKQRALRVLQRDLLAAMDDASPDYAQARQIFSDHKTLEDAIGNGRNIFKMPQSAYRDMVGNMTRSERDMFKTGAVAEIKDRLERMPDTHDAAKKLVGSVEMRNKLGMLFDSPADANRFIDSAISEGQFVRTRQVVAGGSPTSQNLATGQEVEQLANYGLSASTGGWMGAGLEIVKNFFSATPLNEASIKQATKLLTAQGLDNNSIRAIFQKAGIPTAPVNPAVVGGAYGGTAAGFQPLLGHN